MIAYAPVVSYKIVALINSLLSSLPAGLIFIIFFGGIFVQIIAFFETLRLSLTAAVYLIKQTIILVSFGAMALVCFAYFILYVYGLESGSTYQQIIKSYSDFV